MKAVSVRLTVFFDDPFWVGVFERVENGKLCACRVTFGAEPTDAQIWDFVLRNYFKLKYSAEVKIESKAEHKNPKRIQREARKQTEPTGIGTKSQQILKLQYEESKAEAKKRSKELRELEKEQKFNLKQQKRKEKHRGR